MFVQPKSDNEAILIQIKTKSWFEQKLRVSPTLQWSSKLQILSNLILIYTFLFFANNPSRREASSNLSAPILLVRVTGVHLAAADS
ncbi:hypothetical protein Scep_021723 [Stephania cephalantha]|uniref:Uncharacterized protein n=1 Tax=Stephania cephalantha TaxID=152367 RepID=A0AAP0I232_9MAGN